jgi:hypothetical protein
MGFMDKAKEAALQAKVQAQQLAQQGQAKVAAVQQGRSEADLHRALGEAYYAQLRRAGDPEAVNAAVAALDAHYAGAPAPSAAPAAPNADPGGAASGGAAPGGPASGAGESAAPPAGNFTLNDL